MLRWLIRNRLDAAERRLGVSTDYLRHMADVHRPAFFKFARFLPLAAFRRSASAEALHVARVVAARHEDCGTCVQIAVNVARQEGMSAEALKHVLADDPASLGEALGDVYRFAKAVVERNGEDGELRESIRRRYGERALIELSWAIATARVFPTLKRGMGYATSCSRMTLNV